jgi:hypothetical protein
MSKMGSHDPFGLLQHKLWPKEGMGVKLTPNQLKVRNRLDFFLFRCYATYCWKTIFEDYNFALDLTSIGGLHTKLWAPKVVRVSI